MQPRSPPCAQASPALCSGIMEMKWWNEWVRSDLLLGGEIERDRKKPFCWGICGGDLTHDINVIRVWIYKWMRMAQRERIRRGCSATPIFCTIFSWDKTLSFIVALSLSARLPAQKVLPEEPSLWSSDSKPSPSPHSPHRPYVFLCGTRSQLTVGVFPTYSTDIYYCILSVYSKYSNIFLNTNWTELSNIFSVDTFSRW